MAGPNLEIFKFGLYVFFPVAILVHYGNPVWYQKHVIPYRNRLFPKLEDTNRQMPTTREEIRDQLQRMREERKSRRAQQETSDAA